MAPWERSRCSRRPWLDTMLARFEFKGELGPEDVICADFAGQLVQAENDGLTRCVFRHVPNEGKRSPAEGARLKHMGMLPGFGDFVILMAWGSGIIEFKVPDEARKRQQRLSASQKDPSGLVHSPRRQTRCLHVRGRGLAHAHRVGGGDRAAGRLYGNRSRRSQRCLSTPLKNKPGHA